MEEDSKHIFLEQFENLERQGVGSKQTTQKVFFKLSPKLVSNSNLKILDVGCGFGGQTFDLAEIVNGEILAIDNYKKCIEVIEQKNKQFKSPGCKVIPYLMDMNQITFTPGSFDIVWCEGAIYNIGVAKGVNYLTQFLKKNGILAFSEMAWSKLNPQGKAKQFFDKVYPEMLSLQDIEKIIQSTNFTLIETYKMDNSDWFDSYYTPLQKKISEMKQKYSNNKKGLDILDLTQQEIDVRKSPDAVSYDYFFFIVQNKQNQ